MDRIVIWNRTDNNFHTRLSNFRVTVLDAGRQTTFERTIAEPPLPSVVISRQTPAELTLASAAASFCQEKFSPEDCLEGLRLEQSSPTEGGWSIGTRTGQPHAAVFAPDQPLDGREKTLIFRLKQVYKDGHHTLGRFRLSVTAADPPVPAEPIAAEVPLLSP